MQNLSMSWSIVQMPDLSRRRSEAQTFGTADSAARSLC